MFNKLFTIKKTDCFTSICKLEIEEGGKIWKSFTGSYYFVLVLVFHKIHLVLWDSLDNSPYFPKA